MSETKVFHQLELMYNLKQDVDYIVRQLNQQNRLISRMLRFKRHCKDFLEGSNQIGLRRLDLEYTKFDQDYRHLNRGCQKMNRKLCSSLIYDKISNLFVSLSEDCAEIDGGGGQNATVNDNMADEDNVDDHSAYIDSDQSTELDGDEFDEDNSEVSVGERNKDDTIVVVAQQSTPINKKVMNGLENVVGSKGNKSDEMIKCDIEGCQFVTKKNFNLNRHKLNIHNISVKRQLSDPLCRFTSRQLSNLTRQDSSTSKSDDSSTSEKKTSTTQPKQTSKQSIYRCNLSTGCTFVTNQSRYLKQHQRIHKTKQLNCDYDGCDYIATLTKNLVTHQKRIHNLSPCGYPECRYVGKRLVDLKVHRTKVHKYSENEIRCPFGGCEFVTKLRFDLQCHQTVHIDETSKKFLTSPPSTSKSSPRPPKVFRCRYPGCDYWVNGQDKLFHHQVTHNTFNCSHQGCSYAGKRLVDLKVHQTKMHSGGNGHRSHLG